MRSSVQTLLTLYEYCTIIGLNPFWFAQIGKDVPERGNFQNIKCEHTLFQSPYQAYEFLGRDEIGDAIAEAESLIANILGYYPAPKYFVNEPHQYPRSYNRQFPYRRGMRNAAGGYKSIQTKYGHIQVMGIENLTLIDASVPTVLSDETASGIDDTFTATVAVPAGTTAAAIAAFFIPADRPTLSLAESEIKPLNVSIAAGVATITGHISLLVKPILQLAVAPLELSATDNTIYASEIAVYSRATDITDTGSLRWFNVLPCEQPPCEISIETACFGIQDMELGYVYPLPAEWNATTEQFDLSYPCCVGREPDKLTVNYLGGAERQDNGLMQRNFARAVTLLATSLLPNRTAGCTRADQRLWHYKKQPIADNGVLEVSQKLMEETAEVFGNNSRGACEAYKLMQPLIQYGSVKLG